MKIIDSNNQCFEVINPTPPSSGSNTSVHCLYQEQPTGKPLMANLNSQNCFQFLQDTLSRYLIIIFRKSNKQRLHAQHREAQKSKQTFPLNQKTKCIFMEQVCWRPLLDQICNNNQLDNTSMLTSGPNLSEPEGSNK